VKKTSAWKKKNCQREEKGDILLRSFLYFNRFANLYVLFSFFFCAWKDVEEADRDLASVFGDHVAIRGDCSQDLQIVGTCVRLCSEYPNFPFRVPHLQVQKERKDGRKKERK